MVQYLLSRINLKTIDQKRGKYGGGYQEDSRRFAGLVG